MESLRPTAPRCVACPNCGIAVEWLAVNRHRPFCSARCKEADLGAWATERYRVAATEERRPEDLAE